MPGLSSSAHRSFSFHKRVWSRETSAESMNNKKIIVIIFLGTNLFGTNWRIMDSLINIKRLPNCISHSRHHDTDKYEPNAISDE